MIQKNERNLGELRSRKCTTKLQYFTITNRNMPPMVIKKDAYYYYYERKKINYLLLQRGAEVFHAV